MRLTVTMIVAMLGGYLFISEKGTLGLTPMSPRSEDEVWAIFCCPKPLILRPGAENYTAVGPAHLDGHMQQEDMVGLPNIVTAGERYGEYTVQEITQQ